MKTAELTGALLDYWVARAEGAEPDIDKLKDGEKWCAIETIDNPIKPTRACILGTKIGRGKIPDRRQWYYPSTVWAHGGPLIDKHQMYLDGGAGQGWEAQCNFTKRYGKGATALEAVCRAVVLQKFGDTVPDEVAA
jgi:hypothetical protein